MATRHIDCWEVVTSVQTLFSPLSPGELSIHGNRCQSIGHQVINRDGDFIIYPIPTSMGMLVGANYARWVNDHGYVLVPTTPIYPLNSNLHLSRRFSRTEDKIATALKPKATLSLFLFTSKSKSLKGLTFSLFLLTLRNQMSHLRQHGSRSSPRSHTLPRYSRLQPRIADKVDPRAVSIVGHSHDPKR